MNYIHNIGVASDNQGALDPSFALTAFGAPIHDQSVQCPRADCWAQWNIDAILENKQTISIQRLYKHSLGDHIHSSDANEFAALPQSGWQLEGQHVAFKAYRLPGPGLEGIYRMYNPNNSSHYYTMSIHERASLRAAGWTYERIEGYMYPSATAGAREIHHLYNAGGGVHAFTPDAGEADALVRAGGERSRSLGWAPN